MLEPFLSGGKIIILKYSVLAINKTTKSCLFFLIYVADVVSSIIPMMDKTQVNSDCEFYDIYRLLIFLTKCGPYDAMAPSQNY